MKEVYQKLSKDEFEAITGFKVEVPGAELFCISATTVQHPFYNHVYYKFGMKTDKFAGTILELLDANHLYCEDGVIYLKRRGAPSHKDIRYDKDDLVEV